MQQFGSREAANEAAAALLFGNDDEWKCSLDNVIFADEEGFADMIAIAKIKGPESLQIISDFDMTMTKFTVNGKRGCSSHGVIEMNESGLLGEDYLAKSKALCAKYRPLEWDASLSHEEKTKFMLEWWNGAHDLMIEHGFKSDYIAKMLQTADIDFRDNVRSLIEFSHRSQIPFHIFSAGLGDVIAQFLHMNSVSYDNVRVTSNFLDFDSETGLLKGVKGDVMHTLNKITTAEIANKHDKVFPHRDVIVLCGDHLGDVHMSEGSDASVVFKIGFFNGEKGQSLEAYEDEFDVVITGEEADFSFVHELVQKLVGGKGLDLPVIQIC